jgi:hypothetical protein
MHFVLNGLAILRVASEGSPAVFSSSRFPIITRSTSLDGRGIGAVALNTTRPSDPRSPSNSRERATGAGAKSQNLRP